MYNLDQHNNMWLSAVMCWFVMFKNLQSISKRKQVKHYFRRHFYIFIALDIICIFQRFCLEIVAYISIMYVRSEKKNST